MIVHLPTNREFKNRKELKKFLGGTNAYNRELKLNRLLFIKD